MNRPQNTFVVLTALLSIFAILVTAGSLLALFASGWLLQWVAPNAAGQAGAMLMIIAKFVGALGLFIAYLLYVTAREPVRHVAFIDALAGLMFLAAILDIYSVLALHFADYYPAWAIWSRATLRVALGIALVALRPRAGLGANY